MAQEKKELPQAKLNDEVAKLYDFILPGVENQKHYEPKTRIRFTAEKVTVGQVRTMVAAGSTAFVEKKSAAAPASPVVAAK